MSCARHALNVNRSAPRGGLGSDKYGVYRVVERTIVTLIPCGPPQCKMVIWALRNFWSAT
jgi:hypothetical protein